MLTGPAPRPCQSCPYRTDVPSGVWSAEDYAKLPAYDAPTGEQPVSPFLCHQTSAEDDKARLCAGWVGCHGQELLALRMAASTGLMSPESAREAWDYQSPVDLFGSGQDACDHGMKDIDDPSDTAIELQNKIIRNRPEVYY